jgi:HPt (histidine-containing phosphotransfer) domain-containing protein
MAYDPGALEAALAAVAGSAPDLVDDLRAAFFESASTHLTALRTAQSVDGWQAAALRLRSLAASFGASRVMDAAKSASEAPLLDKKALVRIDRALASLTHSF